MRVSVVIPCYNARPYLEETIRSVFSQTFTPCEILVVDDGSSDGSAHVAEGFGDRVRVIRQRNQGECAARNAGLQAACGEWIAFLDADDVWKPNKLELQVAAVRRHEEVVCVHSGFYQFGIVNGSPEPPC